MKSNKKNYLDNIPVRNESLTWDEEDGIVTIHRENKGLYNKFAQRFFGTPEVSHIALEELGSFVWQLIDGNRSIYQIGELVSEEFGQQAEPLYERLSKYFYSLNGTKFIHFKKG